MAFSPASLKHISAISLKFAPISQSMASRSMRLLLARIPVSASGVDVPEVTTKTVPKDDMQGIEVTYKNKQKLNLDFRATSTTLADLVRKVELPAKALRMKEEGI